MTKILYQNILVFLFYFIFFWFQYLTFFKIQNSLLPSALISTASLVFLPHGIRVLSFVFFGPKVFPGLLIAHIITGFAFNQVFIEIVITGLFSTLCVLLAIKIYTGSFLVRDIKMFDAKFIFIISLIAAIINSLTVNTAWLFLKNDILFSSLYGLVVFKFIVGDLIGTIILFYLFIFIRKVIKQSFY
jgi:hypothetical protein